MKQTRIRPCPFCGGPAAPIVAEVENATPIQVRLGSHLEGFVSCHECGAQGPIASPVRYGSSDAEAVEAEAVKLWNTRNQRYRPVYLADEADGLTFYPRAEKDT